MTASRTTTRNEVNNSHRMVWNSTLDWMAWLIFAATFVLLHFGFCAFIVFRDVVLNGNRVSGEGVFGFVFFVLSGVLTSVECVIGYAAVDIIVSMGRASSRRVQGLSAAFGGGAAYALVWVVLALRLQVPRLYENVAGSILNFSLNSGVPWGVMFLGGLMACAVKAVAMGLTSAHRGHGTSPN
jgi:hypothetical protein